MKSEQQEMMEVVVGRGQGGLDRGQIRDKKQLLDLNERERAWE